MKYKIENEFLKVEINSMGAELWSVINKKDRTEHLWQGDKTVWPRRSPILFPYCGRLKGDKYKVDGKVYQGAIHGFARDYEHVISSRTSDSIVFVFNSNEQTLALYPFEFKLYTEYKLENNRLHYSFRVENCNDYEMLFNIGYHTGFLCPFDNSTPIENYSLVFEKKETPVEFMCNEEGLLRGEKKTSFEDKDIIHLINGIFENGSFALSNLKSSYVSIVEKGTGRYVKVFFENVPYLVIWSPPGDIKFVCIEPWYGLPDFYNADGELANKVGIQKISPNSTFSCTQIIEIS